LFGENSACAVVMVSLQTDRVGTIIHTNDEIYRILGYLRKNMVGQKVNRIQPRPVAAVHDTILKRFLSNYKNSKVVNNTQ
jgi:PAS domain S-box-containing protein